MSVTLHQPLKWIVVVFHGLHLIGPIHLEPWVKKPETNISNLGSCFAPEDGLREWPNNLFTIRCFQKPSTHVRWSVSWRGAPRENIPKPNTKLTSGGMTGKLGIVYLHIFTYIPTFSWLFNTISKKKHWNCSKQFDFQTLGLRKTHTTPSTNRSATDGCPGTSGTGLLGSLMVRINGLFHLHIIESLTHLLTLRIQGPIPRLGFFSGSNPILRDCRCNT